MAKVEIREYAAGSDCFERLYGGSAFTWEGLSLDGVEDARQVADWLEGQGFLAGDCVTFYKTTGADFNCHYGLTGTNRYQADLTIVSIENDAIRVMDMLPIQLRFDARWFDDIVDNNLAREDVA